MAQISCPHCQHVNPPASAFCGTCGSRMEAAADQTMADGRYRVTSVLGEGGMGIVFRAYDTRLDREVALKALHASLVAHPTARARMTTEAKALARIEHPNVVRVLDVFDEGPMLVMVLEFVPGGDLEAKIRPGGLREAEVAPLMVGILAGLEAIHDAGLVHRDMKPGNVLVSGKGVPKITDLGIARDGQAKEKTRVGATLGTPEYMSPEQVKGIAVDARSDIYACGIVLYELLTGHKPYDATSEFDIISAHVREPPNLAALEGKVSSGWIAVVRKALAKAPAERFGSAKEMADALLRPSKVRAVVSDIPLPLPDIEDDEPHDPTPKQLIALPARRPQAAQRHPGSQATTNNGSGSDEPAATLAAHQQDLEIEESGPAPTSRRWLVMAAVTAAVVLATIGVVVVQVRHQSTHSAGPPNKTAAISREQRQAGLVPQPALLVMPARAPPVPPASVDDSRIERDRLEKQVVALTANLKTEHEASLRLAEAQKAAAEATAKAVKRERASGDAQAARAKNEVPTRPPIVEIAKEKARETTTAEPSGKPVQPSVAPSPPTAVPATPVPVAPPAPKLAEKCQVSCAQFARLGNTDADRRRAAMVCGRKCPRPEAGGYRACIGTAKNWQDMADCDGR